MNWYCEKCKRIHLSEEMCPQIKRQLSQHPEWIAEAANFTTVAGENFLVSSQALDAVAKNINNIAGTNLSYEGTQQFTRDIQVFRRLMMSLFQDRGTSPPRQAPSHTLKTSLKSLRISRGP